ncbi:MAG: hypothetical protein AAB388_03360 [Patescibacteria group bacterium]
MSALKLFIPLLVFCILTAPLVTLGQIQAQTILNFPNYSSGGGGFVNFLNWLYSLVIGIAAFLAVVKIVVAGVKWMLTDIVSNKSEAKKDIQSALLGLLLIIASVVILNQINPALTSFAI